MGVSDGFEMERELNVTYFLDVVKQASTFLYSFHNRGKVIVSQNHLSSIFGNIRTSTHGHTNIGLL